MHFFEYIKALSHSHYVQFAHIPLMQFGHIWIYMEKYHEWTILNPYNTGKYKITIQRAQSLRKSQTRLKIDDPHAYHLQIVCNYCAVYLQFIIIIHA